MLSIIVFVTLLVLTVVMVNYYKMKGAHWKNRCQLYVATMLATLIDMF
ncbi:hypothetical protein [Lactobacillus sp. Sy-1]|nr:hypothetical protein [Lactobacillus sp. Sy-1]MBW1606092.1 hypothetical protein [Lactobacillus sp. Sy-1]